MRASAGFIRVTGDPQGNRLRPHSNQESANALADQAYLGPLSKTSGANHRCEGVDNGAIPLGDGEAAIWSHKDDSRQFYTAEYQSSCSGKPGCAPTHNSYPSTLWNRIRA